MKKRTTLFSYLYNAISSEIKSGKYPYDGKLPSYKQICTIYEVGIRTVKDVFAALQRDGYIKTEERRRAVVVYRQEKIAGEEALKELLLRRDAIVDSIYAVKPLLCEIIVQSMTVNGSFELAHCRKIIRGVNSKPTYERWRAVSSMLKRLMVNYNNPLIIEIYSDFDIYINTASLDGFENPYELIYDDMEKVFNGFLKDYEKGNEEYVKKCINNMMDRKGAQIKKYLDKIAAKYPQYAALPQKEFVWMAEKRRVYAHTEIARNIIHDLGEAKFDTTSNMLPSIAALAKLYGVSTYTVKEALSALELLGLVEIVNGVGTRITAGSIKSRLKNLKRSMLKNDCLALLYGIQFMALTGKCAALLAYDNIDAKKMLEDGNAINYEEVVVPEKLVNYVINNLPQSALKTVFDGIGEILSWGYYFHLSLNEAINGKKVLNSLSRLAFELPLQKEPQKFADAFGDIWIYILNKLSVILAEQGIEEADKVYIPQYNYLDHKKINSIEQKP